MYLNTHQGHTIQGNLKVKQWGYLDVVEDELQPNWSDEEIESVEIISAYCKDCDVWLVSPESSSLGEEMTAAVEVGAIGERDAMHILGYEGDG